MGTEGPLIQKLVLSATQEEDFIAAASGGPVPVTGSACRLTASRGPEKIGQRSGLCCKSSTAWSLLEGEMEQKHEKETVEQGATNLQTSHVQSIIMDALCVSC